MLGRLLCKLGFHRKRETVVHGRTAVCARYNCRAYKRIGLRGWWKDI